MTCPKSNNVNISGKKSACGLHLRLRKLNACKSHPQKIAEKICLILAPEDLPQISNRKNIFEFKA